ncbi:hypothetical protein CIRG_09959 [Coccidioides immitis RMSCC 2394]|uniref:Uncharacterized protein n=1 Tax=Coccidioides immitis RMSCC 2394 TaxID=404692 RepID=A0A0J6Y0I8_COCIT|nr:hypothetical protein CIRG_09959 [Coccidioides immitis RMSCC 2394]
MAVGSRLNVIRLYRFASVITESAIILAVSLGVSWEVGAPRGCTRSNPCESFCAIPVSAAGVAPPAFGCSASITIARKYVRARKKMIVRDRAGTYGCRLVTLGDAKDLPSPETPGKLRLAQPRALQTTHKHRAGGQRCGRFILSVAAREDDGRLSYLDPPLSPTELWTWMPVMIT